jgi:hypothetical protein
VAPSANSIVRSAAFAAAVSAASSAFAQSGERVTDWSDLSVVTYPRVLIEPGRLAAARERIKAHKARHDFAAFPPSDHPDTDVLVFLATGLDSAARGALGADGPLARLERAAARQTPRPTIVEVVGDLVAADILLSWSRFPPERVVSLRRALAALAYELADPKGNHPPAEIVMPGSTRPLWNAVAIEMIAELLPHHPHRAQWVWAASLMWAEHPLPRPAERGDEHLELPVWSLEPRVLHELVSLGRNPGLLPDANLKDALLSLARRSTPFDAVRNSRTLFGSPGRSPRVTPVFAWAAALYKSADPTTAAEFAWWNEQFGVLDSEPQFSNSRRTSAAPTLLTADPTVGHKVPVLKSAHVPGFGGVIRDDAPSPGELYVAAAEPSAAGLLCQYYHQAFPVLTAAWEPAAPFAADPKVHREFAVTRFAEYMTLVRGGVRQQVIVIKSPVAAAPQYLMLRWDVPKSAGKLRIQLPGTKTEESDGQLISSYPRLGAANTVRVIMPAQTGATPTATPVPNTERGMDWHEFAWSLADAETIALVAFPFDAGTPKPVIKSIAGGAGAQVAARGSTQWVFLSPRTVKFESETADFEGTAGAVREAPAVRSIQIFNGGKARTRDWTVETDGDISVLQRGPSTLLIETDGGAQHVKVTWRRIGRSRPEAIIDGKSLDVRHDEETASFDVPEGKHNIRIDFGS